MDGGRVELGRRGGRIGPEHLRGLDPVGARLAGPAAGEEEHREAVADVAAGIGDGVQLSLREGAPADQVGGVDDDAGLLAQLGHRGRGEVAALLRPTRGQAPEAVVDAAGEKDRAVLAFKKDHRAGGEDGLRADLLPQAPEV